MRLVLVRHGESDGNVGNAYEGAEPHLTERGRRQARYAGERARQRPYHALYSSPMSRALETASALAEAHRMQLWDCVVCAASAHTGARALLTEDMQDGRMLDGLRLINPFAPANAGAIDALLPP